MRVDPEPKKHRNASYSEALTVFVKVEVAHKPGGRGIMSILDLVEQQVFRGINKSTEIAYEASRAVVPVDTANLLLSIKRMTTAQTSQKTITGQIWYSAGYAWIVHEATWMRHATGKTAKFLERPTRETAPKVTGIILTEMQKTT